MRACSDSSHGASDRRCASNSSIARPLVSASVALASAERVLMLEHAVYAVISPEGCASILWRTAEKAPDAAEAMKVTAQDLLALKVIDRIVPEPVGGAHRDPAAMGAALAKALDEELTKLSKLTPAALQEQRAQRFLAIGEG